MAGRWRIGARPRAVARRFLGVTPIATSLEIVIGLAACGVILLMPEPHR
jgi:hypothetical protein